MIPRFGVKIAHLRRELGMSQADVAHELNLSTSFISALEIERKTGALRTVRGLSRVFGMDMIKLLPNWILSCGGATLRVSVSRKNRSKMGKDGMRLALLALLVRNWDRLTESDLQRMIAVASTVQKKWETCDAV